MGAAFLLPPGLPGMWKCVILFYYLKGGTAMEPRTKRDRALLLACLILLLAAVLWLCWLFPLTGDDWYREELGRSIHSVGGLIEQVAIRWNGSNARILGNVLAYSAACRPVLRALLRGGILYGLMLVCWKLSGLKGWGGLLAVSAAVLALPRLMFREVYPWAAGFFNYVPPVLTVLAALYLMRGTLEGREVPDGVGRCAALFWLGLCGQLFMETNTLYALLAGAALLILDWARRKRPSLPIALFLLGAIGGAVLLFSSPAYRGGAGGSYRSALSGGLAALLKRAEKNLPTVLEQMLTHCPLLYGGLAAVGLLHLGWGRGPVWLRAAAGGVLTAGAVFFAAAQYTAFAPGLWLTLAVFLLFALAAVGMILLSGVKAVRVPALFLALSAGASAAPLLAVSPIGPRCLYLPYILLLLALLRLAAGLEPPARLLKTAGPIAAAAAFAFYLVLFVPIHETEQRRYAMLEEALAAGVSEVTVPALPHGEYLWSPEVRLDMVYCYETRGDLIIHFEEENP